MSHLRLASLSTPALEREVFDGADLLAARMGEQTPWYAYAFGDIDSISGEALSVIAARFRFCRSGVRGLNAAGTSAFALRADHVDLGASASYRRLALEGGLDWRYRSARATLDALAAVSDGH